MSYRVSSYRLIVTALLGVCLAPAAHPAPSAQTREDHAFAVLSDVVTAKMREYQVPGVALGIVRNGQITIRGFGVTSVEDPLPVTADTIFPLASISKTVTATAIMRLVEQGRLDLRAPVRKYLP